MVEEPPAILQLCQTQKPASPGFLNVLSEVLHNLLWQHKLVVLLESFSYCLSCIFLVDIKAHCLVQHGLYLWVLHIAENHYHVLLQPSPFPVKGTFFQFSSQTMLPWPMGTLFASLRCVQCSGSTHSPSPHCTWGTFVSSSCMGANTQHCCPQAWPRCIHQAWPAHTCRLLLS